MGNPKDVNFGYDKCNLYGDMGIVEYKNGIKDTCVHSYINNGLYFK